MYAKSILALVVIVASVAAAPAPLKLDKRIAQTISDSTTAWVQACVSTYSRSQEGCAHSLGIQNKAGGGQQCNTVSQNAFMTLLAAGGNCDQQNAADGMVNLAKQLNNDADMIRLAQIFVQQPRNAVCPVSCCHYSNSVQTRTSPMDCKSLTVKQRPTTPSFQASSTASLPDLTLPSSVVTRLVMFPLDSAPSALLDLALRKRMGLCQMESSLRA